MCNFFMDSGVFASFKGFLFNLVQTESEIEVKGLLDDLGIRGKQQFVRVSIHLHLQLCEAIVLDFSIWGRDLHLNFIFHCQLFGNHLDL